MTKPSILLSLLLLLAAPVLADSADLVVVPWTDQHQAFMFSVGNAGPDVAKNVVMTVDVPAALTIEDYGGSRCDTTVRPVRCTIPTLGLIGESLVFDFYAEAPPADATYTITATVTSDTPDPKASNNSASLSFSTRLTARLFPRIEPALARVDPGVTKTFAARLTNFDSSTPTNVKARFVATDAVIESVQPTLSSVICSIASDGASAECVAPTLDEDCRCTGDIKVTLRPSADRAGGEARLALSGTSDLPDPEAGDPTVATLQTYRWLSVDTIEDRGPGSLRAAIEQANALCSPAPCKIVFEIPPPVPTEGWFTITPETPLPAITADRVFVDGKSQRNTTGDTNPNGPVIAIDGHLAHFGPSIHSACEAVVQGLAIGNFDADQGLWFRESRLCDVHVNFGPDRQVITENFIGVDPSGKPWPNLRGVRADGANRGLLIDNVISHNTYSGVWMWGGAVALHRNRIEHNGASGVFLGPKTTFAEVLQNVITNQSQMGVAVVRGARNVDIRQNSMKNNGGLGIDWALDGISPTEGDDSQAPTNAPVLLSAVYDPASGKTIVTYTMASKPLASFGNGGAVDFYVNDTSDGDGEQWVSGALQPSGDAETRTYALQGDHRGKWINATWTRVHWLFSRPAPPRSVTSNEFAGGESMTSELSNAVKVE